MLKLLFIWLGATEVQAGYYMTRTFDSKQQEELRPPGQKSTTLCWSPLCWLFKWRALLNGACVLSARVWTIPHPSVPSELEGRQRLSHIQHPTRSQGNAPPNRLIKSVVTSTETHVWQTPASTITPAWVASVRATASGTARTSSKGRAKLRRGTRSFIPRAARALQPTNSQTSTCMCRGCSLPLPLPQAIIIVSCQGRTAL